MSVESRLDEPKLLSRLLVAVAVDRDAAAFSQLFEVLAPRIRAFVSRGNKDFAEDILQETFVNIWRNAHLYDPAKSLATTWIFAVARNARIDLLRKSFRPAVDLNDPTLAADPVKTPHQHISETQDGARLNRAIAGLSAEQGEILRLAFFADKPHSEIARELGLPLGTVKSRIRLALEHLRRELGEDIT